MYAQPAILLSVLALAGEVLSVSLSEEGARQNHARQARMHRRRGLPANDSEANPCKREASSSSSSKGTTSFRIKDASTKNVTVIPATSYIRQGNGENGNSWTRQPLSESGDSSSDALSDERTSLQEESSAESDSSSGVASSSSSSTSSSAAPAQSSAASTGGSGGMTQVTSWSGSDVSSLLPLMFV